MHGSHVLLALQEQEKWRERKKRLEERLRSVRAQKRYLLKELDAARQKTAQFATVLVQLKGGIVEEVETRLSGLGGLR